MYHSYASHNWSIMNITMAPFSVVPNFFSSFDARRRPPARAQMPALEYKAEHDRDPGTRFPKAKMNPSFCFPFPFPPVYTTPRTLSCAHIRRPCERIGLSTPMARLLLGLEVVEEDGALLRLLTPVLDDDARAVDDLAGVALTVQDACAIVSNQFHVFLFRGLSSAENKGDVQRPAHSPSCLPSGTLMRGILCSEQSAMMSFL